MPSSNSDSEFVDSKPEPRWHNLQIDDLFNQLGSSANGLNSDEVARRIDEYGYNKLEEIL